MVQLMTPAGIWGQLASLCFLLSGMFGDLLVIRICLFSAYVWILINACTGLPLWPSVENPGLLSLDALIWSILNLCVHGAAMAQLIWDERRIKFSSDEEEQLWRFFYRRSGMGRLEYQQSLKLAKRRTFAAGEVILDPAASHHTLMLLVEGLAAYTFEDTNGRVVKSDMPLISGNTFDIGLLNLLGVYIGFEKGQHDLVTVRAKTACTVYTWGADDLNYLTTRCAPAVPAFWRNFALCQVGLEWHARQWSADEPPINGRGTRDPPGVRQGTARSSDFTDPLEEYEDPKPTVKGVLGWLPSQLSPLLPPGMRHTAMPRSGALARNRLMALAQTAQRSPESLVAGEPSFRQAHVRKVVRSMSNDGVPVNGSKGKGVEAV